MSETCREHVVQLGPDGHLVATMSVPLKIALQALEVRHGATPPASGRGAVGVLMLNAGVIHRIGPHRINVKLARQLAKAGIPSARLDLSGLGDSRRAGGTASMFEQVRLDIRCALDELAARTGIDRFVIVGICSGAEYGYLYAEHDPRVAGLVMVDGYSFGNWRTRFLRYGLRVATLTWPVLKNAVMGRLKRWQDRRTGEADPATPVDYGLPSITAEAFAAGLSARVQADCQVYLLYTGSILQRYNHASQFRDVMRALPLAEADRAALARVRCDFLPEIDHTLSTLDGQRIFMDRVCQWVNQQAHHPSRH